MLPKGLILIHEECREWKTEHLLNKMLPLLTNHSTKYFFTNDTGESTEVLFTSQISEIAARKYPIAILYQKQNGN